MIAVVDFGAGNLKNMAKALAYLGYKADIIAQKEKLLDARVVVLPGVGSAFQAMRRLEELELIEPLQKLIREGCPFLGICLGMQVLFERSQEGDISCLGLLPGEVKRLPEGIRIPHMGWNLVRFKKPHPRWEGLSQEEHFYFVHSYYVEVGDNSLTIGETEYGMAFPSLILRDKLVATQFHPEKSGPLGLKLLTNIFKFFFNA